MVCSASGFGCTGSSRTLCCGFVITVIAGLPSSNKFVPFGTEKRSDATASRGPPRVLIAAPETLTCAGQEKPNALHYPRFRGLSRHIHDRRDAERVLGREPRAEISRLRGGTRARPGRAGNHTECGGHRNRSPLFGRKNRHGETQGSNREDRLPGPPRRSATRKAVQG